MAVGTGHLIHAWGIHPHTARHRLRHGARQPHWRPPQPLNGSPGGCSPPLTKAMPERLRHKARAARSERVAPCRCGHRESMAVLAPACTLHRAAAVFVTLGLGARRSDGRLLLPSSDVGDGRHHRLPARRGPYECCREAAGLNDAVFAMHEPWRHQPPATIAMRSRLLPFLGIPMSTSRRPPSSRTRAAARSRLFAHGERGCRPSTPVRARLCDSHGADHFSGELP